MGSFALSVHTDLLEDGQNFGLSSKLTVQAPFTFFVGVLLPTLLLVVTQRLTTTCYSIGLSHKIRASISKRIWLIKREGRPDELRSLGLELKPYLNPSQWMKRKTG